MHASRGFCLNEGYERAVGNVIPLQGRCCYRDSEETDHRRCAGTEMLDILRRNRIFNDDQDAMHARMHARTHAHTHRGKMTKRRGMRMAESNYLTKQCRKGHGQPRALLLNERVRRSGKLRYASTNNATIREIRKNGGTRRIDAKKGKRDHEGRSEETTRRDGRKLKTGG